MKDCGAASSSTTKGTGWLGTVCVEGMQENTVKVGIKYISTLRAIGDNNVLINWC